MLYRLEEALQEEGRSTQLWTQAMGAGEEKQRQGLVDIQGPLP